MYFTRCVTKYPPMAEHVKDVEISDFELDALSDDDRDFILREAAKCNMHPETLGSSRDLPVGK